ncbi:MAG TPA: Uma2 family endonuclease [Tepidiformaceae bacterium]|nr:Uma2 family endonuclease [Tepidiformaceae bacterium]
MTAITCNPTPLESGDRMSREEFHRRYRERPDIKKAELVEGVVYVASPVRLNQHGRPHALIIGWLSTYLMAHSGPEVADNSTIIFDDGNEFQPDAILFRIGPNASATIGEDDYLHGPPELVVEVAGSSLAYDLHDKKRAYERHGVAEYVVWEIEGNTVRWFRLEGGKYREVAPDADGIVESAQFPGLRLDVPAVLAGDRQRVAAAIR